MKGRKKKKKNIQDYFCCSRSISTLPCALRLRRRFRQQRLIGSGFDQINCFC